MGETIISTLSNSTWNDVLIQKLEVLKVAAKYQVNDWLQAGVHGHLHAGVQVDRLTLVALIAVTLVLMHLINLCLDNSSRKEPLLRRLAELDRQLFTTNSQLIEMESNISETEARKRRSEAEEANKLQVKLTKAREELQTVMEVTRIEDLRCQRTEIELDQTEREFVSLEDKAKETRDMVKRMLTNLKDKEKEDER